MSTKASGSRVSNMAMERCFFQTGLSKRATLSLTSTRAQSKLILKLLKAARQRKLIRCAQPELAVTSMEAQIQIET